VGQLVDHSPHRIGPIAQVVVVVAGQQVDAQGIPLAVQPHHRHRERWAPDMSREVNQPHPPGRPWVPPEEGLRFTLVPDLHGLVQAGGEIDLPAYRLAGLDRNGKFRPVNHPLGKARGGQLLEQFQQVGVVGGVHPQPGQGQQLGWLDHRPGDGQRMPSPGIGGSEAQPDGVGARRQRCPTCPGVGPVGPQPHQGQLGRPTGLLAVRGGTGPGPVPAAVREVEKLMEGFGVSYCVGER